MTGSVLNKPPLHQLSRMFVFHENTNLNFETCRYTNENIFRQYFTDWGKL